MRFLALSDDGSCRIAAGRIDSFGPSARHAMSLRLLVLDSATDMVHIGLSDGAREWTLSVPGGARASGLLLPSVMALLAEAGLPLRSLDAIGYGRGPGAFTGVRAACAVTQGLAFGIDRPVLALDTLMAVADDAHRRGAGLDVQVAVDARMGEVYAARFQLDPVSAAWHCNAPAALHAPAVLAGALQADTVRPELAGSSLIAHAEHWVDWSSPCWPQAMPSGAALLALARTAWTRGELLDAAAAVPLYVRNKVAQTMAERAADRATLCATE